MCRQSNERMVSNLAYDGSIKFDTKIDTSGFEMSKGSAISGAIETDFERLKEKLRKWVQFIIYTLFLYFFN